MNKVLPWLVLLVLAGIFLSRRNGGGTVEFPKMVMSAATPVKAVPETQKVRVLLFTGTEWCGACKTLDAQVIATPGWKEFAGKEIRFRSFDFPADRSKVSPGVSHMAQQYGVRAFPTMLVVGPDHEEISRMVGAGAPVENYKAWIRGHERFFQNVAAVEKAE